MEHLRRWTCAVALLVSTQVICVRRCIAATPEHLNGHQVVVDAQGTIIPWFGPPELAYGRALTSSWGFLESVPVQKNGLKTYFTYPEYDPATGDPNVDWFHNPASLYSMLTDSGTRYYAFSGDRQSLALVRSVLDYMLEHGLTPADYSWARVPYSTGMPGALDYAGGDDTASWNCGDGCGNGDGLGVLEPDKIGELGDAYATFYEVSGESKYLEAAIGFADALVAHQRTGDATHSPWPFRVFAQTDIARQEYTANAIGPINLFDALVRLGAARAPAYAAARAKAWSWLMAWPMSNGHWSGYFEDVPNYDDPGFNLNQYIPMETARYLMRHPDSDPQWREHAAQLIAFVETTFAIDTNSPGTQWGATVISEQSIFMWKMGSHTSRYASVKALWYERTGDEAAREQAMRSLNWASYMNMANGAVDTGDLLGGWFTDGMGDYARHFLSAMASVPQWAPPGEDHLLRSSGPIRAIGYGDALIDYVPAEANGEEFFRIAHLPARVLEDGRPLRQLRDSLDSGPGYLVGPLAGTSDSTLLVRHQGGGTITVDNRPFLLEKAHSGCATGGAPDHFLWLGVLALAGALRRRRPLAGDARRFFW